MINSADSRRLDALANMLSEKNMNDFLICSENSLIAADNLRAALTNLNKAYDLMRQLVVAVEQQSSTSVREA
jgi:hypothetical protein